MTNVSVVIPVGPGPSHQRWIEEAIRSVMDQTYRPRPDIVIVDDMAHFAAEAYVPHDLLTYWKSPWYLGVAHAFNIGVAVAPSELVFMLGSDDSIERTCIAECVDAYRERGDDDAYYYVGVTYIDTGETQTVPCHAAMVTKGLWRLTGGFPLESASGAPDAALLSIMLGNYPNAGRHWPVADGKPLYNYRRHADSDTAGKADWQRVILETRHLVTLNWTPRRPAVPAPS